ncbi:MAG: Tetratricopeptide 2 repeat protein [Herbinix sp.]|nr:Tetratricopeptide 2 repeat protein [Herbinix sp.]
MAGINEAKAWTAKVIIPTYGVGEKEKNPMFLEKRVYQGSSGKVYPYPVIDKIKDEKEDKEYQMIFLENQYIQIQIMPEIGGRIYRALDKTNQYDFVYYNKVIKPALVGLAGPWISGGIEFNWPQHHRPNTFGNVEYEIIKEGGAYCQVAVGEIDPMYGTKVTTFFTLYEDKSYIEIRSLLYNRTGEPQTFLWWANPAVLVHDNTQSIFPPDVHAVFDHGKRDVSKFPIATGVYYKQDYSQGVDISRYKNIPVPTSYMAYHSDYDFVGGYDYDKKAGVLHIANHHVSPGKKQWTWGNGEFGQAWDRNLTDEDGPYIELMTGMYTDNQPDFTWLNPYEEKEFTQYFMPYKAVGEVKNASKDVVCGLSVEGNQARVTIYTTGVMKDLTISLKGKTKHYFMEKSAVSPIAVFDKLVSVEEEEHDLLLTVHNGEGKLLLTYQPSKKTLEKLPEAAKPIGRPGEIKSTEGLFLAGQHIEQYRHATYVPDDYYLEGLKRDSEDIRLNNAYGKLLLRRADFVKAEQYFRAAVNTTIRHNPNPYDGEPYFNLGKTLKYQNKLELAFDAFFKATWSQNTAGVSYFALSQIAATKDQLEDALVLIDRSLELMSNNLKGKNLKIYLLRKLERYEEAAELACQTIAHDPMNFAAYYELYQLKQDDVSLKQWKKILTEDRKNYLALASDYADFGGYQEVEEILGHLNLSSYPMTFYYLAYAANKRGNSELSVHYLKEAAMACPDYCFPTTLFDAIVLQFAITHNPTDDKAYYYLGNLLYDKRRVEEAVQNWEKSILINRRFPTALRNLSLAYYNKVGKSEQALALLEEAFLLNQKDARVFYELDQLYRKMNEAPKKRLDRLRDHMELVGDRTDLLTEYITLLNRIGEHDEVLTIISKTNFHPWEGGEGKIPTQYVIAKVEIAKRLLSENKALEAITYLEAAKVYPLNLGEGKLKGAAENNIDYYLGTAYEMLKEEESANQHFILASVGIDEPAGAMFYNDQPPHMIYYQGLAHLKLGNVELAKSKFNKLISYGEKHIFEKLSIDYFAVSLPDFLVFEENLDDKNKIHCNYMMALGHLGLGNIEEAKHFFHEVLAIDPNHAGAVTHYRLIEG